MPPRDARALLVDIIDACANIHEVTRDRDLRTYSSDWKIRAIVERQFITIGEAVSALIKLDPTLEHRISRSRQIVDFRNLLVHGYSLVDHSTVWSVVQHEVETLALEADAVLNQQPPFGD